MPLSLKRLLIGRRLRTEQTEHERLPKILALPIFASDALSSVAYASGEIMAALLLVGTAVFYLTVPISLAIVALLFIVATSYRQTVLAYPGGGGAYIVARENLGIVAAQVAGSAILIDYILTVAVSVSSGVAAIRSLAWTQYGVTIPIVTVAVAAVIVVALINLRGVKESGAIFAIPTYIFIAIVTGLIGFGVWLFFHQTIPTAWPAETFKNAVPGGYSELRPLGWFLILQAFASGCAALTGVEAISDGCTAFKQPVGRNAAITMVWLAVILGFLFLGLSWLAVQVQALPETAVGVHETVVSQIGRSILGAGQSPVGTVIYFLLQVFTALILVLAANTSFAGFPRLAAIIARDGFLPKQLGNLGDRLVFDRGIITLTILSVALIIWKKADVHRLIPLYAVGVFLSFTISQAGLVLRWYRLRSPGWQWKATVNGVGATVTGIVLMVITVVKFTHGAYLVVILIPAMVFVFLKIHAHYKSVEHQAHMIPQKPVSPTPPKHAVLVLIPGLSRGALEAVEYARSLAGDIRVIHIEVDPEKTPAFRAAWLEHFPNVTLVILASPYRSLIDPLVAYLDEVQKETPNTQITVVLPEIVPARRWQNLLHGQSALMLKLHLMNRRRVVVTNVRYHMEREDIPFSDLVSVDQYRSIEP